jgi:hypothetical protein
MRGACQARGCRSAQVYCLGFDEARVDYVEDWDDEDDFRSQFRSERFLRLLGLIETSAEPPIVEFRAISGIYGLDYITSPACTGRQQVSFD